MNIKKPKPRMMVDIVLNGNILSRHLQQINKDEQWVIKKLKSKNINNVKDVIFAGIQADQKMYVVTYDDSTEIDL